MSAESGISHWGTSTGAVPMKGSGGVERALDGESGVLFVQSALSSYHVTPLEKSGSFTGPPFPQRKAGTLLTLAPPISRKDYNEKRYNISKSLMGSTHRVNDIIVK